MGYYTDGVALDAARRRTLALGTRLGPLYPRVQAGRRRAVCARAGAIQRARSAVRWVVTGHAVLPGACAATESSGERGGYFARNSCLTLDDVPQVPESASC